MSSVLRNVKLFLKQKLSLRNYVPMVIIGLKNLQCK